ncbi:MAG: hypothetical protein ACFFFT_00160 [Candidatus Thorarchaeota archaeon]
MSYSEHELHQALVKLFTVMNVKITTSTSPNPTDFEFLAQLRVYMNKVSNIRPKEENSDSRLQTKLRSFLRRAKPWERMETPIPDVSIIKVPTKQSNISALYLVINHMKRELDITTAQTFQRLKGIFTDSHVNALMKEIDQVNKTRL